MPRTKKLARKQTGKKTRDTTTSFRTFQTEADQDRYLQYTSERTFCIEKGFLLQNTPSMGYDDFITSVIVKHKWQNFCAHPCEAVVPVVREFYAHFAGEGQQSVYVRGVQVPVDETTINQVYGLADFDDRHTEYAARASADSLARALANVCMPGTVWLVSPQGKMTVHRTSLTPQCKVWYHFLKTRLLPSTHGQTVSKDRILLLDSMISGRSINVGAIISENLGVCAKKKCGSLWFPALITSLCVHNGVPILDTEERLSLSKGAIDDNAVARLVLSKMADGISEQPCGPVPPAPSHPTAAASCSSGSTPANLLNSLHMLETRMSCVEVQQYQTMEMLQQMHSQHQQYWQYAKHRDLALRKSLQKNFTKPTFSFPDFPDDVLEHVAADEETDEADEDDEEDT